MPLYILDDPIYKKHSEEIKKAMDLNLNITSQGGIIVELSGNIAIGDADTMSADVIEAISRPIPYLIFDFSNAKMPNSRFLGKMLEIYKLNKYRNVSTYIYCGKNKEVRELFKAAYVDHIIPTIKDLKNVESVESEVLF